MSTSQPVSQDGKVNVVLGTMTFGSSGVGSRVHNQAEVQQILSLFQSFGYDELDTARMYCEGNTEIMLGELNVLEGENKFKLATKVYPFNAGDHQPKNLRATFETSLQALKSSSVDIFYLHAPDHTTEIQETLSEVDKLYKEGKFRQFALSNYTAWQVVEIYYLCKLNNYVLPTIYQGMYNLLTRDVETELLPALKRLNIRFYAYNPLCGGLVVKEENNKDTQVESGSRFDSSTSQGKRYCERYWNSTYFQAVTNIVQVAKNLGLTPTEVALRWLANHSQISPKKDQDAIIIGVSSLKHTQANLEDVNRGPLPQSVLVAIEEAWKVAKPNCPKYFR